jgi:hypothetical protein
LCSIQELAGFQRSQLSGARGLDSGYFGPMTVYVDTMQAPFKGMLMCHMIADSEEELHAMAAAIGMQRKWYQRDHYDISMERKHLAIEKGAREIGRRELAALVFLFRAGQPMGDPETAVSRMRAWKQQHKAALAPTVRD